MTDSTKKIALPAFLARRCEAFRMVGGDEASYLLRDKLHHRTHDFDARQWFILESLVGVETLEKLQSVFRDRFDRELRKIEVEELFESLVERKLLDPSAMQHPLLRPYASELFKEVDGEPVDKATLPPPPPPPRAEAQQKVVLPAYINKRLKAYRNQTPEGPVYYISDDVQDKSYRFEPWQFFVLEVLPGCETIEKLQTVCYDRFARRITKEEFDALFVSIADRKMFDPAALQHKLLAPFATLHYDVVDGKAVPRTHAEKVGTAPAPAEAPAVKEPPKELPAGVQDFVGMDPEVSKRMLPLFDPRPILRWLVPVLRPLRYAVYLAPLFIVAALFIVYRYGALISSDLGVQKISTSLFTHLVFSMLTLNLTSTILYACILHYYKVMVDRVCITNYIGFVPRFVNRFFGMERLPRRQMMITHGSALLLRIFVFSAAVLVWFNTRDMQDASHQFALMLMVTALGSLVLETGNPLMKGHAYFLLAAYLNEPHLRGKAFMTLRNKLSGKVYSAADGNVLALYALAFIAYSFFLVTMVTLGLGEWMQRYLKLGGSAVIIVAALLAYLYWKNYTSFRKYNEAYERAMQFDMWRKRTLIEKGAEEGEVKEMRPSYWPRALLICLFLILFIPYPYEPSGGFTIYPARKQVLSTDTPGLVDEVFYDGGESVKAGSLIATLAHEDYISQIKVLNAQIDEQRHVVADLKARPKPEEIQVAEQAVEVARTRERFSRDKVPRLDKLYKVGAVTLEELETARKEHDTDVQQVQEKLAQLALVKAGVTAEQIAAAESKLVSLEQERGTFVSKLDRTSIRMPFDGNILTLHLKDRTNSFLDKGQPFVQVEYTGVVTAEIDLAEADAQYVKVNAPVRVRPNAYFEREFVGKITTIDRNITVKPTGTYIKVIATIDNPKGELKTGMAGEGKVDGPTMPVWEAFGQAIIRFVRVQVWSWLP